MDHFIKLVTSRDFLIAVLAAVSVAGLDLVVHPDFVVGQLLHKSPADVELTEASQIADANNGVGQFDFQHLAMRQVIVHSVLAIALHSLG